MFQATRRRLALWYTSVTAVLLLLFATGFYGYVHHTLIDRIDDTLKHVVEVVERSIPDQSWPRTRPGSLPDEDHIDLEWFDPEGNLVWSTLSAPLGIPLSPSPKGQTVYLASGYGLRQVTRTVQEGEHLLGFLRVSHPWFEVTKPIRQLGIDLSVGLALMLASAAAIGWLLSGLAMRPVWESYERLKQFTADASHELRSPIASIQTNVQVALSDPDLDPQAQQAWGVVERLTRRLGRLVEDLLFLARQDSGIVIKREQPCPLDGVLLEVIEEQDPLAQEKGVLLTLGIPEDEDFILQGDYDQLARLFTNLVSNAIRHTPSSGSVRLDLQKLPRHGPFQVKVSDTGSGIPEEALPHVFDRFYRADPARSVLPYRQQGVDPPSGSGLGLAIAAAIVQNHHGQIRVESKVGQGTTFTVTLPRGEAKSMP